MKARNSEQRDLLNYSSVTCRSFGKPNQVSASNCGIWLITLFYMSRKLPKINNSFLTDSVKKGNFTDSLGFVRPIKKFIKSSHLTAAPEFDMFWLFRPYGKTQQPRTAHEPNAKKKSSFSAEGYMNVMLYKFTGSGSVVAFTLWFICLILIHRVIS